MMLKFFRGKKEVVVTTTGSDKQRITAMLGVTASNIILTPVIILKGKKVSKDVEEPEDGSFVLAANPNAWMTEEGMLLWIARVWRPYSSQFSKPLLILNQFRIHKLDSIMQELKKCNTDVVYIPAGLTFYLQLCDVYLNKPLKDQMRKLRNDFMFNQNSENSGKYTQIHTN